MDLVPELLVQVQEEALERCADGTGLEPVPLPMVSVRGELPCIVERHVQTQDAA